jgi:anti-sigma B factor antagonist
MWGNVGMRRSETGATVNHPRTQAQSHASFDSLKAAAKPFTVTMTRNGAGCTQAVVVGEIDVISLDVLESELASQPSRGTNALVVDLSRVPFCSAGGVRLLLELLDRTTAAAVPLELVVDTPTRRDLACLEVLELLSIHVDRASALAAVDAGTGARFRQQQRRFRWCGAGKTRGQFR